MPNNVENDSLLGTPRRAYRSDERLTRRIKDLYADATVKWRQYSASASSTSKAGIAQLVERQFCKLRVGGSSPSAGSISRRAITELLALRLLSVSII